MPKLGAAGLGGGSRALTSVVPTSATPAVISEMPIVEVTPMAPAMSPAEIGCGDHDGEHEDGAQRVLAAPAAALRQRHEHDQVVFANLCLAPAAAQHRLGVAQTDRRMIELFDAAHIEPVANGERLGDGDHFAVPLRAERVVQHDDGAGHQVSPVKR